MILISRRVLVVLVFGVLGCEPLDSNAPLLVAHSGGVLSQAALDGALLESSSFSNESRSDSPAPEAATDSVAGSEDPEDSPSPEESAPLAVDGGPLPTQGRIRWGGPP